MELRTDHIPIILNQSSNIYHEYKSHVSLYNQSSFICHVETPTHPSQSMNIEVYFIPTPCHFDNQPSHLKSHAKIVTSRSDITNLIK